MVNVDKEIQKIIEITSFKINQSINQMHYSYAFCNNHYLLSIMRNQLK